MTHTQLLRLCLLVVSLFLLSSLAGAVQAADGNFGGGDGSEGNPYQIEDADDLQKIKDDLDAYYVVMNDIDASVTSTWNGGQGFEPMGSKSNIVFTGVLDGNGYSINGLFIDRPSVYNVALFEAIGFGGVVKNLKLTEVDIRGKGEVGAVAAYHNGDIMNVLVTGTVRGEGNIGGAIAICESNSTVRFVDADVDVYGNLSAGGLGFTAYDGSVIDKSVSRGSVYNDGATTGGFLAINYGYINNSRSYGEVNGSHSTGGLVGSNDGTINNSFSTGTVTGEGSLGGLVGSTHYQSVILNSYSTGTVTGTSAVGGLIGFNYGFVNDSYSWSDVNGQEKVGGLIGENERDETEDCGILHRTYSTGSVNGTTESGGLIGSNLGGFINLSFWDVITSGETESAGGTGKNTTAMQNISTFTSAGWDFDLIWFIQDGEYPTLRGQRLLAVPGENFSSPVGVLVTFNGSASLGFINNWTWSFMYDASTVTLYNITASFVFEIDTVYEVSLTVRDEFGANDTQTVTVTITETTAPTAVAGENQTVNVGTLASFNGTESTDNVGIVTYTWTFTYDGETVTLNGPLPTFEFLIPGEYVVTLTVSDLAGNEGTDTLTITVLDDDSGDDMVLYVLGGVLIIIVMIIAVVMMRRS